MSSTWLADFCPWTQVAVLAERVQQWQVALIRHDQLRQAPAGKRTEEKARRETLANLETDFQPAIPNSTMRLSLACQGRSFHPALT